MNASDHPRTMLIENGRLVDPSQLIDRTASLLIEDGRIAEIDPDSQRIASLQDAANFHRIDASGLIVSPGLVDLCVEFREPGREEDETIASGCAAALAGGYTTVLCGANTHPPIDSPGAVEFVRQKAVQADGPNVHVVACVSKGRQGEQMAELGLLTQAGAIAFSDSPSPIANSALIKRALDYCRMLDIPIMDRPQVPELAGEGVMHDGQVSLRLGLRGLPTEGEDLAVARDVRLAEATGGRLHVGPISTMGGVDMLRRVKSRGIQVTASVCPHNLLLTDVVFDSFDSRFKVHPPLRSVRHVQMLRDAVADGTIDVIQSGHMPRAQEKKMNDLDLAPFGMASLETSLAVTVTAMVHGRLPADATQAARTIDWLTTIDRLSTAPARIAGVPGGSLAPGQPADVILIDPQARWTVEPSTFHSHCRSTPHEGDELVGRVVCTIVGGREKFQLHALTTC